MSSSSRRLPRIDPGDPGLPATDHPSPAPAVIAGVTAPDGSVIGTVSRHLRPAEPAGPGAEVVVGVHGDLDLDTAPLVQAAVVHALDGSERVCLDLSEVSFFGAAGARVVLAAQLHAVDLGRSLRLSGVHGMTARVLALTGVYPQD
ncbi:hypothetical protein GCM10020358_66890 [Amorphoplanes nipponensis]|uniref:STAS domain-containing protein n=1 Tax=Actinoplanes nipponensis TaxID=135950 RepID=A0A919JQX1_9ACTN|nr:STAS domain-containing protein [Actinoplanes nipponensis]GIE53815.1 hypothetical protein Ani05nite_73490 [Actinoplanes nipponensis]